MESEPEATQSPKDKRVGWSGLSVYNEDAPRQLLSFLAALGEVMPAPPEQQAFKKEMKTIVHRRFLYSETKLFTHEDQACK